MVHQLMTLEAEVVMNVTTVVVVMGAGDIYTVTEEILDRAKEVQKETI